MTLYRLKQPINSPLGSFPKGTVKSAEEWKFHFQNSFDEHGKPKQCADLPDWFEPAEPVYILQRDLPDAKAGTRWRKREDTYYLIGGENQQYRSRYVENNEKWFKLEGAGETADDFWARKEIIQEQIDAARAKLLKTKPSLDEIIEQQVNWRTVCYTEDRTHLSVVRELAKKVANSFNKSQMESVIEEMENHRQVLPKGALYGGLSYWNSALDRCISIIKKHLHN